MKKKTIFRNLTVLFCFLFVSIYTIIHVRYNKSYSNFVKKDTELSQFFLTDTSKIRSVVTPPGNDLYVKNKPLFNCVIFTSFLPNKKRYTVYNNTKRNWPSLCGKVKAVLFTNDSVLKDEFKNYNWDILPLIHVSKTATPVLKHMFLEIAKKYETHFVGYANADILFTDSLCKTFKELLTMASSNFTNVMLTGRRINIKNVTAVESQTFTSLTKASHARGVLHRPDAEDYFFTNRFYPWRNVPEFVIGREAYDNFLLLHARMLNFTTIDLSKTVTAVHQTVDKGHLEDKWKRTKGEKSYNRLIIRKHYRNVNYYAGMTNCLDLETRKYANNITLRKRQKHAKICTFRTYQL